MGIQAAISWQVTGAGVSMQSAEVDVVFQLLVDPAATIVTTPYPAPDEPTVDRATRDNDGPDMPARRPLRFTTTRLNNPQRVVVI